MPDTILNGTDCSAVLSGDTVTISGNYYRYDLHRRRRVFGPVTVTLQDVLRIGLTKTYSRLMLAFPMCFGFAALGIRAIPSIEMKKTFFEVEEVWDASVGVTLWSLPHQDFLWRLCAALCLFTIPLYRLSYHNDLEINTLKGRYLLPQKGMGGAQIAGFQQEFTRLKEARRRDRNAASI